jgi:glycosyltransferase involved in cell wall biosynthesis
MLNPRQASRPAEVCLILEGTYPYVSGGVSTWVHQLLTSLPDVCFEIIHIGASRGAGQRAQYEIPANVASLRDIFLEEDLPKSELKRGRATRQQRQRLAAAARASLIDGSSSFKSLLLEFLEHGDGFTFHDLWTDREMWDVFNGLYDKLMPDSSFKDFFWTARSIARPIWNLLRACDEIGTPKVFFTACTGYAGMLAAVLSEQRQAGFLLSEHGIYVRERLEEMRHADWIRDQPPRRAELLPNFGKLKSLWMMLFCEQAALAYGSADEITSLFGRNASIQEEFGASPEKISIVPNGVSRELLDYPLPARESRRKPSVGFLGRIVQIKDVKSLLRAAATVIRDIPDAQFLIAGPTEEEPAYYHSCIELACGLGISDQVHFVGTVEAAAFLREIDVNVLSSVSEGMPFSILEGFALGVPAVSTDVGACRELIEGPPGDRLGHAGIITEVREPAQLAGAIMRLLSDAETRAQMGAIARSRVERYYLKEDVMQHYLEAFKRIQAKRGGNCRPAAATVHQAIT